MRLEEVFEEYGQVDELAIDADFQLHQQKRGFYREHRVTITEVLEVHEGDPAYFLNPSPTGRAPVIMVGPTAAGRMLVLPVEPAGDRGTWRVVTAYEAKRNQVDRYKGAKSR